jgi:hypothetical protein
MKIDQTSEAKAPKNLVDLLLEHKLKADYPEFPHVIKEVKDGKNVEYSFLKKEVNKFKAVARGPKFSGNKEKDVEVRDKSEVKDTKNKAQVKEDPNIRVEENRLVKQFIENIVPQLVVVNSDLKGLFAMIKDKVLQSIKEAQNSSFFAKQYNIKVKEGLNFPFELAIKKVDGKFKITLLSTGALKDEIKRNLVELIEYLKKKDIDLYSIDVLELRDIKVDYEQESDQKDQRDSDDSKYEETEDFTLEV